MLIIGAKGMAKELLEILSVEMHLKNKDIVFFDDINTEKEVLYDKFKILTNIQKASHYFLSEDNRFTLGLGNPHLRKQMAEKFMALGGELTSVISSSAKVGSFNTTINKGCQIMQGAIITNDVYLGEGVLINLNSTISHECVIGDYTEIACNVSIPGRCSIGKNVFIGSNATLMPDISIGDNTIIGAGTVVINDVPANVKVVGNPNRII
ncbi:acetyltransferase [Aequorivita sp. SDUM287046]|uniref:Acetyltransferase n=1 Tax=Aequorivita aurantiaca TaxID=3053356 RepID=A0ABT8DKB7_9FLAO|nr:acetyltransferase [Aequorivita aurantiaca]MDN3725279.1 acetyltransferase [Aequorivita aurantiaca]